jgi:GH25 family lysozyme M1 (1,4-beta-N-acetylmuramidase)
LSLKLGGKFPTGGFHVEVVLVFQRSNLTTGGVFGEYYKLTKKPLNKEAFVRSLTILSNELEKHYQKKPILYTELSIYHTLIKDKFPNNPIWIREVRTVQSPNCPWLFWQFSVAKIDGIVKINKNRQYVNLVDINKFNGNKKDFNHFVNQKL